MTAYTLDLPVETAPGGGSAGTFPDPAEVPTIETNM